MRERVESLGDGSKGEKSVRQQAALERLSVLEDEINGYFDGADEGIMRFKVFLLMLVNGARREKDRGDSSSAMNYLRALESEFDHIKSQLDPVGGPSKVRSIPLH